MDVISQRSRRVPACSFSTSTAMYPWTTTATTMATVLSKPAATPKQGLRVVDGCCSHCHVTSVQPIRKVYFPGLKCKYSNEETVFCPPQDIMAKDYSYFYCDRETQTCKPGKSVTIEQSVRGVVIENGTAQAHCRCNLLQCIHSVVQCIHSVVQCRCGVVQCRCGMVHCRCTAVWLWRGDVIQMHYHWSHLCDVVTLCDIVTVLFFSTQYRECVVSSLQLSRVTRWSPA